MTGLAAATLAAIGLCACSASPLGSGAASGGTGGTATSGQGGRATGRGGYLGTGGGDPIRDASLTDPYADGGICRSGGWPPVNPWTLVPPSQTANAGSATADAAVSGCSKTFGPTGTAIDTLCSGAAWLRGGAGGPALNWDDGSGLVWSLDGWHEKMDPPAISGGAQRVWARLEDAYHKVPCQSCGEEYDDVWIEVRTSAGGPMIFFSQSGFALPEPTTEQLVDLFGTDAEARTACIFPDGDGCASITRTVNDHLLHTNPPQVIPPAEVTTVRATPGTFQVLWLSGSEQITGTNPTCVDGPSIGPPFGFSASLVVPQTP